jgi:serine/threonine protein kinase
MPSKSNGGQNLDVTSFQVLSKIGQGGFGTVLLVRRYANGQIYAMKVLLKSDMQEGDAQRVVDEEKALAETRQPFVVQLLFAFHDDRHVRRGRVLSLSQVNTVTETSAFDKSPPVGSSSEETEEAP